MDGGNDYLTLLFIAITIVLVIQLILNYISSKKQQAIETEPPKKIIAKVRCIRGDYEIERDFREGDFVGKIDGQCPVCGAELVIDTIYAKPLTTTTPRHVRI